MATGKSDGTTGLIMETGAISVRDHSSAAREDSQTVFAFWRHCAHDGSRRADWEACDGVIDQSPHTINREALPSRVRRSFLPPTGALAEVRQAKARSVASTELA